MAQPRTRILHLLSLFGLLAITAFIVSGCARAIEAGVDQVRGVNFTVEGLRALPGQAREKAVDDAQERAQALGRLAHVKVEQELTMSESGASVPVFADAHAFGKGAGASTPLSPGEVQITYQVQVTYAIE